MIHGNMRTYANGRKKKYNAWNKPKKREVEFTEYKPTYSTPPTRSTLRQADTCKSVVTNDIHTAKVESPKYTGTLIKGIGTMHKSNAIPIINESEAVDLARMRR